MNYLIQCISYFTPWGEHYIFFSFQPYLTYSYYCLVICSCISFLLKWSCGSHGLNSFLEGDVVFSWLMHFGWVVCRFVALAHLRIGLFGIRPYPPGDSFSCLVDLSFTSQYSSSWDVQIDRILYTVFNESFFAFDVF